MTTLNAQIIEQWRLILADAHASDPPAVKEIDALCDMALSALQPEEPTEEMMRRGAIELAESPLIDAPKLPELCWRGMAHAVYKAMRAAMPRCASQPEQDNSAQDFDSRYERESRRWHSLQFSEHDKLVAAFEAGRTMLKQPVPEQAAAADVEKWRNAAFETSAKIAEAYGCDPWVARDIRALITTQRT